MKMEKSILFSCQVEDIACHEGNKVSIVWGKLDEKQKRALCFGYKP